MQLAKLPENDPLLAQIKGKLKREDVQVFFYAIRNGHHDIQLKILEDNFNKAQAKDYNEKLMFWIRKKELGSKIKSIVQKSYWSKSEIIHFLEQNIVDDDKKKRPSGENLMKLLQTCPVDIRVAVLSDNLPKRDCNVILPHINAYLKNGEYDDIDYNCWTEYQLQVFNFILKRLTNQKAQEVICLLKMQEVDKASSILKSNLNKDDYLFIENKIRVNFDSSFGSESGSQLKWENPQILSYSKYGQKEMELLFAKENNKQKKLEKMIYDQLQEKFGLDERKSFEELKNLLQKGKRKKAVSIVKDILGKKDAQYYKKKIYEVFVEKVNMPLQNATFYKANETGIKLYELQSQSHLDIAESQMINVMIVGMTGVGKTTFLNSLVNYLMDVQMEDSFRYIISKDGFQATHGKAATRQVCIYSIPKQGRMKKAMRLIDIPGLADTDGIKRDKQNLEGILKKIKDEVPFLNLVLYVFKASQTRVTKEASYVMGQVMGMFGKDMGENIRFILTFADKSTPRVLDSLETSFSDIISVIKKKTKDWYLIVNNSALFERIDEEQGADEKVKMSFYDMGQICLQKTLNVIESIPAVSTKLSQDVMKLRKQLQQEIKEFEKYFNASLKNQSQIRKLIGQVANEQDAMDKIHYKYQIEEERIQTKPAQKFVTSCLNCKFTCHSDCAYEKNQDKDKCCKMKQGNCTACPQGCHWTAHINDRKIVHRVFVKVSKTHDELEKKYMTLESSKTKNQSLIVNLFNDYIASITMIKNLCEALQAKTILLANIELKKVNHLTVVDYIDILIAQQEHAKEKGFEKRIEQLRIIKSHHKRLAEILDEDDRKKFTGFAELMRKSVKQLIPNSKIGNDLTQKVNKLLDQMETFQRDVILANEAQNQEYAKAGQAEQATMCNSLESSMCQ